MRVFMSGATGFIGRALMLRLQRDGHSVCAWVRSEERARSALGGEVELLSTKASKSSLVAALKGCDAVVNLAGESIASGRWTARRKRALVESRVGVTERLVDAMAAADRPSVLVSASAIGVYGDRRDEVLDEDSSSGGDFLAELCLSWERAAGRAEARAVRVVCVRTGIVLGREGGALAKLVPLFRAGLGGRLGSGEQYVSWIHLHDLVEIFASALVDERLSGAVNAVAPSPVTNRELTRSLARALHKRAPFVVPRMALRLALGEAAKALLNSQRVQPARLQRIGFAFRFPRLDAALTDLVSTDGIEIASLAGSAEQPPDDSGYLARRHPRQLLCSSASVPAPREAVFGFFSRPANLGVMTPPRMGFHIVTTSGPMRDGAEIEYLIRVGPVRLRWRTRIESWSPRERFVDSQLEGPYRAWWHEHVFSGDGQRTFMADRVYYAVPFGWLGRLANRLLVEPELRRIFGYRNDVMRLRFGARDAS